jgi:hypothetical protein
VFEQLVIPYDQVTEIRMTELKAVFTSRDQLTNYFRRVYKIAQTFGDLRMFMHFDDNLACNVFRVDWLLSLDWLVDLSKVDKKKERPKFVFDWKTLYDVTDQDEELAKKTAEDKLRLNYERVQRKQKQAREGNVLCG